MLLLYSKKGVPTCLGLVAYIPCGMGFLGRGFLVV